MSKRLFNQKYDYVGSNGRPGFCQLEIYDLNGHPDLESLVVVTELSSNPGPSVTNSVEDLVNSVCRAHMLNPAKMVWVEVYPPHSGFPKTVDMVYFDFRMTSASVFGIPTRMEVSGVGWMPMGEEKLWKLLRLWQLPLGG